MKDGDKITWRNQESNHGSVLKNGEKITQKEQKQCINDLEKTITID